MTNHISKKELFARPSVKEILKLPTVAYDREAATPALIARLVQRMSHDQSLLVDRPLHPARRTSSQEPKTALRHGKYLELRRQPLRGRKDIFRATPFELLEEKYLWREFDDTESPVGWRIHIPGRDDRFIVKPFNEEVEGALLFIYDMNKYPEETDADRTERLAEEVQMMPHEALPESELEQRIRTNGANLLVRVPSRSQRKTRISGIYSIPLINDSQEMGKVWRRIHFAGGNTLYNMVLQGGQPSDEQRAVEGEPTFVTAEQNAMLLKVAEFYRRQGNMVPSTFLPVLRFLPRTLDYFSKLVCNTLVKEGATHRHLHDDERSALLGQYFLHNPHPCASIIAGMQMRNYRIGRQGRRIV